MRIALLGDLHGNLPATQAVWNHIQTQQIDAIYCLGDLVGKGPDSPATMDWALAHCEVNLLGNWDEIVAGDYDIPAIKLPWYQKQLGPERLRKLAALPKEHRFDFAGRHVRLLHGRNVVPNTVFSFSPLEQRESLFDTTDGYIPTMVGFADIHRPFYQHMTRGILFNTGSVGNPLMKQPYPSYVILDGEPGDVFGPLTHTIVQLDYDREAAIKLAQNTHGLPDADAYINEIRTGQYSR